ncbi:MULTISPECIES: RnfABCDGE type electron transport complex subunit D [Clostridium]|jgi:electron transport complex, RnfABCDGE type, D subunit|uniref:Ion-translocating oxidoreductase complex subunit D n=3 Tax=Clostridium TaxID=1485 RepID=A0A0B5QS12_CLOBE|nr:MULTISPECIES: RnfABCDGE type electron transport complex subunit D [Clostridium]ABR34608.1 electron transport complex, RnfABCDGE type, D subunit [Clostridium beijerinckii NCIMB 8052]AIU04275.1 electron transport complex, RnfABCDGE type, D subunit [Clostridium beijerinckii ATCC 35702]AJG99648.1 electron transporter RnfD [Clostridium beijerinckii]AQS05191.1 electron transport complex subunit RsxD [Clostridium beijerinckii]MBA2887013.1 electron transport complex protein RnfD [Clostridium beijer
MSSEIGVQESKVQGIKAKEADTQENSFTVSASPHIRCDESISKIMWNVNIALAPAAIFSIYYFGIPALINLVVGAASAVAFEYLVQKFRKKKITAFDGSAFLTGLLLAMCVSPTLPVYMIIAGSFVAIVIAKHSMGGLGYNIFNPAHIGRAALMVSWPVAMTTWTKMTTSVDVVSSATPLNILKQQGYSKLIETFGGNTELYKAMFIGTRNGSAGETSTILLIIGGAYLIYKGYIKWQVPVCMIGTVGIITWIFGPSGLFSGDPIFHMMAGGLIIGAFFMATDMVTAPITLKGQIIFAVGAGLITSLIRLIGGYPEGVCYSLLLMNAVTPLIDRFVKPKQFGARG